MGIHYADHSGAADDWTPGDQRAVVPAHQQHPVECHFRAVLCAESVHVDMLPRFHLHLVSRGLNNGEHELVPSQCAGWPLPAQAY